VKNLLQTDEEQMDKGHKEENIQVSTKRSWLAVLKRLLFEALPFLFIPILVLLGLYIWDNDQNKTDPDPIPDTVVPDTVVRQQALEENWELFLSRDNTHIGNHALEKFELALCPFSDPNTWDYDISPEEAGMICGYVTVPLFHEQPEKGNIWIPVAIWPTDELPKYPDPLFVSQGGPGGSTLEMYPAMFYASEFKGQRDIVFVDQRGTRCAKPALPCPEGLESWIESSKIDSDEDESTDEYASLRACRIWLTDYKDIDLAAFTTAQIARDFEVVRQVFGYEKINFYGVSYGTLIGQYLAAYYPESLRSIILDGVTPVPFDYLNRSDSIHNQILTEFINSCNNDLSCSDKYPDLEVQLKKTLTELDQNPREITLHDPDSSDTIKYEITGEEFYYFIITRFLRDNSYALLPYLIEQAEQNRFDYFISDKENGFFGNYGANGLYFSVLCAEHEPLVDADKNIPYILPSMAEWENTSQEDNREECAIWNVKHSLLSLEEMPISDIPALLLSGHFDPVTPPEYGEQALESFPNGKHVIDPIGAHGIAFSDECTISIVESFLLEPSHNYDSDCLADPERRSEIVPPSAFMVPFLNRQDVSDPELIGLFGFPLFMTLLMMVRGSLRDFRQTWKSARGSFLEQTVIENRFRLRFELATWAFTIGIFGLLLGLIVFITQGHDTTAYLLADAYPGGVRWVLFIPTLLLFVLPIVVLSSIKLWRHTKTVSGRFYFLIQIFYCLGMLLYLGYVGLLFAWI